MVDIKNTSNSISNEDWGALLKKKRQECNYSIIDICEVTWLYPELIYGIEGGNEEDRTIYRKYQNILERFPKLLNEKFGLVLRIARKKMNFSISTISELTGLSSNLIGKLEKGSGSTDEIFAYRKKLSVLTKIYKNNVDRYSYLHLYEKIKNEIEEFPILRTLYEEKLHEEEVKGVDNSQIRHELRELIAFYSWVKRNRKFSEITREFSLMTIYDDVWYRRKITEDEAKIILKMHLIKKYGFEIKDRDLEHHLENKTCYTKGGVKINLVELYEEKLGGVLSKEQAIELINIRLKANNHDIMTKAEMEKKLDRINKTLKPIKLKEFKELYDQHLKNTDDYS